MSPYIYPTKENIKVCLMVALKKKSSQYEPIKILLEELFFQKLLAQYNSIWIYLCFITIMYINVTIKFLSVNCSIFSKELAN